MARTVIPIDKMADYIKYCQERNNTAEPNLFHCPICNKVVKEGPIYPYFYDSDHNDVWFASICPECGMLIIGKE